MEQIMTEEENRHKLEMLGASTAAMEAFVANKPGGDEGVFYHAMMVVFPAKDGKRLDQMIVSDTFGGNLYNRMEICEFLVQDTALQLRGDDERVEVLVSSSAEKH